MECLAARSDFLQKGDRIAFLGMACNEFLLSFMAAQRVGAVWLGLSPKFTVNELGYMMGDCRPRVLISLREYMGRDLAGAGAAMVEKLPGLDKVLLVGEAVDRTDNFTEFISRPRPHLDAALVARTAELSPSDDALLMYTSGSTGQPKGVMHTHRSMLANVAVEKEKFRITEDSRMLLHFPINHVAADVEIGLASVCSGGALIMMDRFDAEKALNNIMRERITILGQVPAMYLLQMQHPAWKETDFSGVETFIWSGASASPMLGQVLGGLRTKYGCRLLNAFGLTETAGLIAYTNGSDSVELLLSSPGKLAEPFELRIEDEHRRTVPDGDVGEIAVRGEILMSRYWGNEEATEAAFDKDGWFYTNDLARRDGRGYIHLAGRKSDMFKSGGENVFPREVEKVIESHPSVMAVAVVGVPDVVYAEVGRAFLIVKQGKQVTAEELREYCRARLANFKVPKQFIFREHMPLLANGKVNKRLLCEEIHL